jgi:hypothetical protein
MTIVLSHTHGQGAQANAKSKAGQRVCLSNCTTKSTEKEARCPNSGYVVIAGEVVNRRSVLLINFVLNGQVSPFGACWWGLRLVFRESGVKASGMRE